MPKVDLNAVGPVLRVFIDKVASTPRPPGGEDRMLAIAEQAAAIKRCTVRRDGGRNMYIDVPASGRDGATLGLQVHADMVCERAPGSSSDPRYDPIPLELFEEHGITYLRSQDCTSTIGADNGVGLAMVLAILEDTSLVHPPLEIIITVEEEIGLKGAQALNPGLITADRLINLDTEDEGIQTIATAGACSSLLRRRVDRHTIPSAASCWRLSLSELRGGHSGLQIHRRASAIQVLVELLQRSLAQHAFLIRRLQGGTASNVIPTAAFAEILLTSEESAFVESVVRRGRELLQQADEGQADVRCQRSEAPSGEAWDAADVLRFLAALPYGALSFSDRFAGLVELSNNVWKVDVADQCVVACSSRAMTDRGLDQVVARLRGVAAQYNADFEEQPGRFPAWEPRDSCLQRLAAAVHQELFGKSPQTAAFHAGIELSVIKQKLQNAGRTLDATSIGPTIHGAHTVKEQVDVASVDRVWRWLCQILARID